MKIIDYNLFLQSHIPASLEAKCSMHHDMVHIECQREKITDLIEFLKNDKECDFKILTDLTACDYPERASRFEVVYNLLSLTKNLRVLVKVAVAENQSVASLAKLYSSAVWFEREVWDMYGIIFDDSPDLRRILTDYGFNGHPLRKDFPLTGYVEVKYDAEQQKVIYQPVSLPQEFRNFDFLSPWEGTDYVLPGDEKAVIGK